jgi:hypothetical protein
MPDTEHDLIDILRVLERMEEKLHKQDERFDQLETPPGLINGIGTASDDRSMKEDRSGGRYSHISNLGGKALSD